MRPIVGFGEGQIFLGAVNSRQTQTERNLRFVRRLGLINVIARQRQIRRTLLSFLSASR